MKLKVVVSGKRAAVRSVRASGNFDAAVKSAETTRHFQEIWTRKYPWLRYVPTENKMFCSLCKASGKNNALAVGTDKFRTSHHSPF